MRKHEDMPEELRPYDNGRHPGGSQRKYPRGQSPKELQQMKSLERRLLFDPRIEDTEDRLRELSRLELTPEMIDSIEALVLEGNWPHVAAVSLGIKEDTYRGWYAAGEEQVMTCHVDDHDPQGLRAELYLRVSRAVAEWEVGVVQDLEAKIAGNSTMWIARMTQLERRDPSRWGRRDFGGPNQQTWEDQVRQYLRGRSDERAGV